MKIKVDKELKNNTYSVLISIIEINTGDYINAVHDFGEEPINFGGKITNQEEDNVLAIISDRNVKITELAESPISQGFSSSQYGENAEIIANRWAEQSIEKIDTYAKKMAAKIDTFTSTEIIEV